MQTVELSHNPYKLVTTIVVDGEPVRPRSQFEQYLSERFQIWVDKLPYLLRDEYNDDEFTVIFCGTELDYGDLEGAASAAAKKGITLHCEHTASTDHTKKEDGVRKVFSRIQKLPFEELRTPGLRNSFEGALNDLLEVNVFATMSAGKSTLINALLGRRLMPAKQGACTATIARITDNDDEAFSCIALDAEGHEIYTCSNLTLQEMKRYNADEKVSQINIQGNIPFVSAADARLVMIDTPGPDNARNSHHRQVTAKALKESSKMLVLFVMNGGNLHNESQDLFLRDIAKLMAVEGKQSKERFLFVISKVDQYSEDEDDIANETLPETVEYLERLGIHDPNIFPVASLPALLIRQYFSGDEQRKAELLPQLKAKCECLNTQSQLHLEKYSRLPSASMKIIEDELRACREAGDIWGEALIHSGIRNIEEMICMYVNKYCRPDKIRTAVDSFSRGLDDAHAYASAISAITENEKKREKAREKIERVSKKLESESENTAFKDKIKALKFDEKKLYDKLTQMMAEVQRELNEVLSTYDEELDEDDATLLIKKFNGLAESKAADFTEAVEDQLESDIKGTAQNLRQEYIKRLRALSEEMDLEALQLETFVGHALENMVSVNQAVDDSITEKEYTKVTEGYYKTEYKKRFFLNPARLWDGDYKEVQVWVPGSEKRIKKVYVSLEKLSNHLLPPIVSWLGAERSRAIEHSRTETSKYKQYFLDECDKTNRILKRKADEFVQYTAEEAAAEKAKAEAMKLKTEVEEIKQELSQILDI